MKLKTPDIITAGFPCQGMSVAGKKGGFSDDRSALFFEFIRIARRLRPPWVLVENVPGFRTAPIGAKGRDFAIALAELDKIGYGISWTSLDAQYFGLAQRRKRVFIVGRLGRPCPPEILFERESVCGHTPPGRETGEGAAGAVAACLNSGGNKGGFRTEPGKHLVAFGGNRTSGPIDKATARNAHRGTGRLDFETETFLVAFDTTQITSKQNRSNPEAGGPCHTLAKGARPPAVAFQERTRSDGRHLEMQHNVAYALTAPTGGSRSQEKNIMIPGIAVRRLTPRECERLQGFPDDWTLVKYGRKMMSDSARYRMLGLAVAVPVAQWILRRLKAAGAETVGELFSGIGGFALAAKREGLKTLWASEICPQAQAVYRAHFPDVKLIGDICELVFTERQQT